MTPSAGLILAALATALCGSTKKRAPASGLLPEGGTASPSGLPGCTVGGGSSSRIVTGALETGPRPIGEGPNSETRNVFGTVETPWSMIRTENLRLVSPGPKSSSPLTDVKSWDVAVQTTAPHWNGELVAG